MKNLELKPFDQAAFDAAYKMLHSTVLAPIVQIGTLEYVAAVLVSMAEHGTIHISLTALDHMTPEAALFAQTGDYRAFVPSQAFLDDVAAHTVSLIGVTHWFDAP